MNHNSSILDESFGGEDPRRRDSPDSPRADPLLPAPLPAADDEVDVLPFEDDDHTRKLPHQRDPNDLRF